MTDPIADLLTRLRNALAVGHAQARVPYSKLKLAVAELLRQNGYLGDVSVGPDPAQASRQIITMQLKYRQPGQPAIAMARRISRPGRRVYVSNRQLPRVLNDLGIAVVSTSQGVMTNREARKRKLGGEVVCEVY